MFLLFDIDHTLIDSAGAGLTALRRAFAQLHSLDDPEAIVLDLAGSTDRSVFEEFTKLHQAEATDGDWQRFCEVYLAELRGTLPVLGGRVLPGVPELLDQLETQGHTLSLLTGNLREGAELKLKQFGLEAYFDFALGAYGGERANRNELGPLALARASAALGQPVRPTDTVIFGDTPRDIACARACGAYVVALATGNFSQTELAAADWVVADARALLERGPDWLEQLTAQPPGVSPIA